MLTLHVYFFCGSEFFSLNTNFRIILPQGKVQIFEVSNEVQNLTVLQRVVTSYLVSEAARM